MKKTTSVTCEDVYDLYERNKRVYDDCYLAKKKCPSLYEDCYCRFQVPVLPLTIGDQFSSCNIKTKRYIKPYEECPICLEQISSKTNAYLTNCGHTFHKSCLFKSYEINLHQCRKIFKFTCPLCRKDIFYPDFYCRYPQWCVLPDEKNYLDVLEEFWLSKDYTIPELCRETNVNHYLGMKNNCMKCLNYRKLL